eukprot:gene7572-15525_t
MSVSDSYNFEKTSSHLIDRTLVNNINKLLEFAGLNKLITDVEELIRVSSSMFVAIFEALFQVKLDGIRRTPMAFEDYVHNAQLVVNGISQQIQMNLQHISGKAIVCGDLQSLSNLSNVFLRVINITQSKGSVPVRNIRDIIEASSSYGNGVHQARLRHGSSSSTMSMETPSPPPSPHSDDPSATSVSVQEFSLSRSLSHSDSDLGFGSDDNHNHNHNGFMDTSGRSDHGDDEEEEEDSDSSSNDSVRGMSSSSRGKRRTRTRTRTRTHDDLHLRGRRGPGPGLQWRCLRMTAEDIGDLLRMDSREALLRVQRTIVLDEKQEAARSRRQRLLDMVSNRCGERNRHSEGVALQTSQRRWLEALECEERSFILARSQTDTAMLQKIYKGYLRKLREWRTDEHHEVGVNACLHNSPPVAGKVRHLRASYHQHIQNLTRLFEDRVRTLKESDRRARCSTVGGDVLRDSWTTKKELEESFRTGRTRMLELSLEEVRQERERQMYQRKEAHRCLLQLLAADDWTESLRVSPAIVFILTTISYGSCSNRSFCPRTLLPHKILKKSFFIYIGLLSSFLPHWT